MLETFPCRWILKSARASLFMSFVIFAYRWLNSNVYGDLIDKSVEWHTRLQFCQITLFIVFFSFVWALDIWPMID